ncbi:MAG: hypothetical protein JST55_02475 [Bacteroidetes bacterium]|nr:hypothetical protein [Bacteroidota bacterium]
MIRALGILIIGFFMYYVIKVLVRMFLTSLSRKANTNPPYSAPPKPKSNLDKSKAIEAQFEELK